MAQHDEQMQVLHYFFQYPRNRSIDLFRSLSKQLIQTFIDNDKHCPREVANALEMCYGGRNRVADLREVIDYILIPLLSQFKKLVVCIDGIEECDHKEQRMIWDGARRISQLKPTRVMITSRSETMISRFSLDNVLRIRLDQDFISQDIETYIEARLCDLSGPNQLLHEVPLQQRVKRDLLARANRMYVHSNSTLGAELTLSSGSSGSPCKWRYSLPVRRRPQLSRPWMTFLRLLKTHICDVSLEDKMESSCASQKS